MPIHIIAPPCATQDSNVSAGSEHLFRPEAALLGDCGDSQRMAGQGEDEAARQLSDALAHHRAVIAVLAPPVPIACWIGEDQGESGNGTIGNHSAKSEFHIPVAHN